MTPRDTVALTVLLLGLFTFWVTVAYTAIKVL